LSSATFAVVNGRGGSRRVQHVRPNNSPTINTTPTGQTTSYSSATIFPNT